MVVGGWEQSLRRQPERSAEGIVVAQEVLCRWQIPFSAKEMSGLPLALMAANPRYLSGRGQDIEDHLLLYEPTHMTMGRHSLVPVCCTKC